MLHKARGVVKYVHTYTHAHNVCHTPISHMWPWRDIKLAIAIVGTEHSCQNHTKDTLIISHLFYLYHVTLYIMSMCMSLGSRDFESFLIIINFTTGYRPRSLDSCVLLLGLLFSLFSS